MYAFERAARGGVVLHDARAQLADDHACCVDGRVLDSTNSSVLVDNSIPESLFEHELLTASQLRDPEMYVPEPAEEPEHVLFRTPPFITSLR